MVSWTEEDCGVSTKAERSEALHVRFNVDVSLRYRNICVGFRVSYSTATGHADTFACHYIEDGITFVDAGVAGGGGGLWALYGLVRVVRARIYDATIVKLTTGWYAEVLRRLPAGSKMLDVGIGTGLALANNDEQLRAKSIAVDGVDYDADYVARCRTLLGERQLASRVQAHHASIYDFSGPGPYDAVYFSSSLMLMPDAVKALQHCVGMLKPKTGRVFVTQTIQNSHSKLVEIGKPLLKFLTTIDFGSVTYEEELLTTFKKAGLTLIEHVPISGSTMTSTRSFRLFVLEP